MGVSRRSQPYTMSLDQQDAIERDDPGLQNQAIGSRLADCEAEGTLFAVIVGGASQNIVVPWNCELCDCTVIPTAVQAGGTVQIQTAGGAANITDAIACAAVGIIGRMGVGAITPANMVIAAGATLKINVSGAATAGKVTLNFKKYQTSKNTNADGT